MIETYVTQIDTIPRCNHTAGSLGIAGSVKYQVQTESNIDDCWITEYALPHSHKMHKDKKAMVTLGKAVLRVCFDAEASNIFLQQIV